jgi:hypothetical protein
VARRDRKTEGKPERKASGEERDCTATMDRIDRELRFLSGIVQLVRAASFNPEAWRDISFPDIAVDMLHKLDEVKKFSRQLFDRCRDEGTGYHLQVSGDKDENKSYRREGRH